MKKKVIALGLLALGLTGAATVQFGVSQQLHQARVYSLDIPAGSSPTQLTEFVEAFNNGDPLPAGFAVTKRWGEVKTELSGFADPATGDVHQVTTIIDRSVDLDTATLSVDGQVVVTATRQNGKIFDRSGKAVATLAGFVPSGYGHTIIVEWISSDGVTVQSHEMER